MASIPEEPDLKLVATVGEFSEFSVVLIVLAELIGVFSEAIFLVISKNAYLKDLEEQGELPVAEAEIFA